MSINSLANAILSRPGFRSRLDNMTVDSVGSQFSNLEKLNASKEFEHDWQYLLTCASILAQSRDSECEDAALRIAQHTLLNAPDATCRDAACIVFDTLTNKPSINLAVGRNHVESEPFERLPLPLKADWLRREAEHMAVMSDGEVLMLNRFQKDVWDVTCPRVGNQ